MLRPYRSYFPQIATTTYVDPSAQLVGDIQISADSSIWPLVAARADVNYIRIGARSNIQDGAVIHCTYQKSGTVIGNKVSIAHNAVVHGCTIHDNVLIGMGAIIMDNAVVHSGAVIAAGAVVLAGTIVEPNSIYAGMPAKKVKDTGPEMLEVIERTARNYPMYATWFKESDTK